MNYKIFIYGGFCSGKSWLAEKLSKKLNISVYHLDDIYWYGNWEHKTKNDLLNEVKSIINNETDWIIEGNYKTVRDSIAPYCNVVYFCYAPLYMLFYRCFRRSFDRKKNGVPKNVRNQTQNKEPIFELFYHVLRYRVYKFKTDKDYLDKWPNKENTNLQVIKCKKGNVEREVSKYKINY